MKKVYAKLNELYCKYILNGRTKELKTMAAVMNDYDEKNTDIRLCIIKAVINFDLDNIDKGDYFLVIADKYRKFLRINDNFAYCIYLFACSMANIKKDRAINAVKYMDKLVEEYNQGNKYAGVFAAFLYDVAELYETEGFLMLMNCYRSGIRSRLLYSVLFRYYANGKIKTTNLLNTVIKWCVLHNVEVGFLIKEYKNEILLNITDSAAYVLKLYEKYPYDFILKHIVRYFLNNFDYSQDALNIYEEAYKNGFDDRELYETYLMACIRCENDDIPEKIYDHFLENPVDNRECMCRIYMRNIKRGEFREDIYKFALACHLDNEFKNADMDAYLYMYGKKAGTSDAVVKSAGKNVFSEIFGYKVYYNKNAESVKYIALKTNYSKENRLLPVENGKGSFKSTYNDFYVVPVDDEHRAITGVNIKIWANMQYIYFELVLRLYNDGYRSYEILEYMARNIIEKNIADLKYMPLLEDAAQKGIMTEEIIYMLFYMYAECNKKDEADYYIDKINIENIDDIKLEYIAKQSIVLKNAASAKQVLSYYKRINKETVKKVLIFLYEKEPEKAAEYACEFISGQWICTEFLNMIFKSYKGDKKILKRVLENISAKRGKDISVSVKILEKCMEANIFSGFFENNLYYVYYDGEYEDICKSAIDFVCGAVIANEANVSLSTVNILEDFYYKTDDYMTAFALGHIYIRQNMDTQKSMDISEEIVKICEKTNISFPIFYYTDNLIFKTPFIIKNKPLIYKTRSNSKVTALISFDDEKKNITSKDMTEIKYGLYLILLPVFMGEKIYYCFEENKNNNTVMTHWRCDVYPEENMIVFESDDVFFAINNSINRILKGDYHNVEKTLENIVLNDNNSDFKLL